MLTARGIIIPDGEEKIIQSLEKGVVSKILIKEGTSRGQRIYWHPDKCGLNDAMLRNVFNIYVGDRKTRSIKRVKPVEKSVVHEDKMSIETAILFLVEHGYTGVITRQPNIYTIETIDLGKIK